MVLQLFDVRLDALDSLLRFPRRAFFISARVFLRLVRVLRLCVVVIVAIAGQQSCAIVVPSAYFKRPGKGSNRCLVFITLHAKIVNN